ncbi:hypothetical protein CRYUN_Cryun18bG0086400 [Craigia yunnanensis]
MTDKDELLEPVAKLTLFPHMCAPSHSFVAESSTDSQDSPQGFLTVHNSARAAVGVRPMTWDDTVAAYAKNYDYQRIGDCELVHSAGPYVENLAWSSDSLSGTDAVKMWIDEETDY